MEELANLANLSTFLSYLGSGLSSNKIIKTSFSVYEVDYQRLQIRRLEGLNEPTPRQGKDGEWKPFEQIYVQPDNSLLINWEGVRCTVTSPVQEVSDCPPSSPPSHDSPES